MPEHTEHERAGWIFEGLDRVVFDRPARNLEAFPYFLYPLVVVRLGRCPLRASGAGGERVGDESHLVVGEGARCVAVLLVAQHVGEVLFYGASVGDVEDLQPAADTQDGHLALECAAYQRELVGVALLLYGSCLGVPFVSVEGGVQVPGPSRDDERVEKVEHLARVLCILRIWRQQDGTSAGALYSLEVARRADDRRYLFPDAVAHPLGRRRDADVGPRSRLHWRSKFR